MNSGLEVIRITNFEREFVKSLPETYTLLASANLVVRPNVSRIVLHGSRGLAGGYRPDSDIDLSLVIDLPAGQAIESELRAIVKTTLENWHAAVEPDLAVIFELKKCELKCFDQTTWNQQLCQLGGVDCFGIYKIQKGFNGLVTNAGIQVKLMYPCLKIWQRR